MKKYLNKLVIAAVALFAAGAVSCSEEKSELPEYYFDNFVYMELFPDTNTSDPLVATNDYRGVAIKGALPDFYIKLRFPVATDTKVEIAVDKALISGNSTPIPAEYVKFALVDSETDEVKAGDFIIPAGEMSIKIRPTLTSTEFALENKAATTYTAPVTIKQMSGSDLKISTNRNQVNLVIGAEAYKMNNTSILTASNSSSTAIPADNFTATPTLSGTDFEEIKIALALPAPTDTKVKLVLDPSDVEPGCMAIPVEKATFKVNNVALTDMTVTIPAGETSVTLNVSLVDDSFLAHTDLTYQLYSLPIRIKEVVGEQVFIDPTYRIFQSYVSLADLSDVAYTESTLGVVEGGERKDYKKYMLLNNAGDQLNADILFDDKLTQDTGSKLLAVCADVASVKTLSGLKVHSYATGYSVKDFEIYISEDGVKWVLVRKGTYPRTNNAQQLSFSKPFKTQHIKYNTKSGQSANPALREIYFYFVPEVQP